MRPWIGQSNINVCLSSNNVNALEKSEPDLFEWLEDYQDDVGILCETHPRLSQLIDDYIALLAALDGMTGEVISERLAFSEQLTLKSRIVKALVSASRQDDQISD